MIDKVFSIEHSGINLSRMLRIQFVLFGFVGELAKSRTVQILGLPDG